MKRIKNLIFLLIIIFPLIFFPLLIMTVPQDNASELDLKTAAGTGISKYAINQSVTYTVDISFTITHVGGIANYYFNFPQLINMDATNPTTPYNPPYQKVTLISNTVTGYKPGETSMGNHDEYNNTYDTFNATLNSGNQTLTLHQVYNVTLNEIYFGNITAADIGILNTSDPIYNLYLNKSVQYYPKDDPTLISAASTIVGTSTNPLEKAQKIINWVSTNLVYNGNLPAQEKGALYAYVNKTGDCSEFSSLAITLLRIQGIPARKVTGLLYTNNGSYRPKVGDFQTFILNNTVDNRLGHAWLEYYLPNIGWIASDALWHQQTNYFNRMDYLRFTFNMGEWFDVNGIDPPNDDCNMSEFSNPSLVWNTGATNNYEYKITMTVTAVDLKPLNSDDLWFWIILIIIICLVAALVAIIIIIIKKRN